MVAVFSSYVYIYERQAGANSVIKLIEKCIVGLSLELQQIECALTHNANDLYVTADRGHVLIVPVLSQSMEGFVFVASILNFIFIAPCSSVKCCTICFQTRALWALSL